MAPTTVNESFLARSISQFFLKTKATRSECDGTAVAMLSGTATPVAVQGDCSYTIYVGPNQEYVVQFRPKSLELSLKTAKIAKRVFGVYAPAVLLMSPLGGDGDSGSDGKEPLIMCVMTRFRGIRHLDFMLAHRSERENSAEWLRWRENLVTDLAKFFALAWKTPLRVVAEGNYKDALAIKCKKDMEVLLTALPDRFRPVIQKTIDCIPAMVELPIVLLHKNVGSSEIMVDSACHLVGVIDWAEAEVGPFGLNMYSLQSFMCKIDAQKGWVRYQDYDSLNTCFWDTLRCLAPDMSDGQVEAVKAASILGLLRWVGLTGENASINDDENRTYKLLILDGLLVDKVTRIV